MSNNVHTGSCGCDYVKYQVKGDPLIVHCCHCSFCQTQTGSAFVVNALFEQDKVELLQGEVKEIVTPSPSGKGQTVARCPICNVALWSNYYMRGLREKIRFIRVGTLDDPAKCPPDVHIYTDTKQPWVQIPEGHQVETEFYDIPSTWSPDNFKKLRKMFDELDTKDP